MLYFGDRVAVLNDFIYQTGGSTTVCCTKGAPYKYVWWPSQGPSWRTRVYGLEQASCR
jgi:hypothetical protein